MCVCVQNMLKYIYIYIYIYIQRNQFDAQDGAL